MRDRIHVFPSRWRGLAAVVAVAATYFYFLLFAEFALLELARALEPAGPRLRMLMGVLGIGGVAGSVIAAWRYRAETAAVSLVLAFLAGAGAAVLALWTDTWSGLVGAAGAAGFALGWLTVTLASTLRAVVGRRRLGLCLGAGTGLAYAACNLPFLFTAGPQWQTFAAVAVACVGALAAFGVRGSAGADDEPAREPSVPWRSWVVALLVLVWFDSAAFYIIQHAEDLRRATWEGEKTLLGNAGVHLVAALVSGWLLDRGVRVVVTALAFVLLSLACIGLDVGAVGEWPVGWLYTAGVSLYSVVLVQVPASIGRPMVAAAVFAISGWLGSALGIGMAQDLQRVPSTFVLVAAGVLAVLAGARLRKGIVPTGLLVFGILGPRPVEADEPLIRRGRDVYIAEGCIHCHSQYVRPGTDDVTKWGPAADLATRLRETPPLFGNRRQGPDLAQVGNRRNETWNRLHLIAPRALSPGSRMPSYAHLFTSGDRRGEALVAYLGSLGEESRTQRDAIVQAWTPAPGTRPSAAGARRFAALCAPCHGETGAGDGPLAGAPGVRPADFGRDAWRHVRGEDEVLALMRIVKFGLPGTAMAGHEYLADADVFALALHARALHASVEAKPAP